VRKWPRAAGTQWRAVSEQECGDSGRVFPRLRPEREQTKPLLDRFLTSAELL